MTPKPHSVQDDFAVLRTHGFCENMADRENFGDRQCWERRWHRKNWCIACTERMDAIERIEEQFGTLRNACEQGLLLVNRGRFDLDPEVKVMRAVFRSALASSPASSPESA